MNSTRGAPISASSDQPAESQPPELAGASPGEILPAEMAPAPSKGKPAGRAANKTVNAIKFMAGFLGWYIVSLVLYAPLVDQHQVAGCGALLLPVYIILLVALFRKMRFVGWGMLAALAANLVISIIIGQVSNAVCFIPFYVNP